MKKKTESPLAQLVTLARAELDDAKKLVRAAKDTLKKARKKHKDAKRAAKQARKADSAAAPGQPAARTSKPAAKGKPETKKAKAKSVRVRKPVKKKESSATSGDAPNAEQIGATANEPDFTEQPAAQSKPS